jgi:hypothetical protein
MFIRPHTLHRRLRKALAAAELPTTLTWYQCTRHSFASQWVLADGSIEKLSTIMGHSSVTVTEKHYAHMRPDLFRDDEYQLLALSLERGPGDPVEVPAKPANGQIGRALVARPVGPKEADAVSS